MIRPAKVEDAKEIARLGAEFHAEACWADIVEYVPQDCEATIRALIENEGGIVLVVDLGGIVGFAGGATMPTYFNHGHKTGQELFWWMHPDHRTGWGGKLLDALEDAARGEGCASWGMICLDKVRPAAMGKLYERRGYRASEHSYIKVL